MIRSRCRSSSRQGKGKNERWNDRGQTTVRAICKMELTQIQSRSSKSSFEVEPTFALAGP